MAAGDISAVGMDAKLRESGWHFRWILAGFSRHGYGTTEAAAVAHAITCALRHIRAEFNVAEVDQIQVSNYGGFRIARVTAHARQISSMQS